MSPKEDKSSPDRKKLDELKRKLYLELLGMPNHEFTEIEIELLYSLSRDPYIQRILELRDSEFPDGTGGIFDA